MLRREQVWMKAVALVFAVVCAACVRCGGNASCVLKNAESVFVREGKGTVAFLGGSITEMPGYRPRIMKALRAKFPHCAFTEIAAGLSSTCSDTGAFRVRHDILSKGKIDLLFVEFAVNDDQDGHFTEEHSIRGMEGIVRQVRAANPACEIVMIYFVNQGELQDLQKGKTPIPYAAHAKVAQHYGIPTVNVGAELARRIAAGEWTWAKYGGEHPSDEGNDFAASLVWKRLAEAWTGPVIDRPLAFAMPPMLDSASYAKGRRIPLESVSRGAGWNLSVPDWKAIAGNQRSQYCRDPILWSDQPGSTFTFSFVGTAVGAFVTSYVKDAGALEVSVDGGAPIRRRLLSPWSAVLHYPMTVMLSEGLAEAPHTVTVRLVEDHQDIAGREQPNRAGGKVARIHALCINGEQVH